ncbi:hypothetical protein [Pedobacter cryoconitis]|uniref:hypothetical protein n=1 Tax=Pedobacter cryoconitis TaxID=188932 RepID=UPI0016189F42|nr:hypothetical protein [Pedobacter cryoconitis]
MRYPDQALLVQPVFEGISPFFTDHYFQSFQWSRFQYNSNPVLDSLYMVVFANNIDCVNL